MSDLDDHRYGDEADRTDDEYDYEYDSDNNRQRQRDSDDESSGSDVSRSSESDDDIQEVPRGRDDVDGDYQEEDEHEEEVDIRIFNNVCQMHKPGQMSEECRSCLAGLSLLRGQPDLVRRLTGAAGADGGGAAAEKGKRDKEAVSSSLLSKYGGRCDSVKATLVLHNDTVKLARKVLAKGAFRDKAEWKDIQKDFLLLPEAQHEQLVRDIKPEDLFKKFRSQKRFKAAFKLQADIAIAQTDLRMCQRPLYKMTEVLNEALTEVRAMGVSAGLVFSNPPPSRSGISVPRGVPGRSDADTLKLDASSAAEVFPRPDLTDFFHQVRMDDTQKEILSQLFEDFRLGAAKKYLELFQATADVVTNSEDLLIFYFDLFSHADAGFRNLQRKGLAGLFKEDVKKEILSQSSHKNLAKAKSDAKGLFGGNSSWSFVQTFI